MYKAYLLFSQFFTSRSPLHWGLTWEGEFCTKQSFYVLIFYAGPAPTLGFPLGGFCTKLIGYLLIYLLIFGLFSRLGLLSQALSNHY
ncbi:hypothetical protein D0A37_02610 [Microcoleus vaginatus HSN003]|nr:hypothetical protein D0A37_02610 [Microcoleus vaginatus HSN003]